MRLDAATRRRYARQLLLGEVGEAGQERLLAARFRRDDASDQEASLVAAEYLERAGCTVGAAGDTLDVPDESTVMRFAGKASLAGPAAAIVGAFCAVEAMKRTLGCGESCRFPEELKLSTEP